MKTVVHNDNHSCAVTHVLVNDATEGYGIFMESMLNHVEMVAKKE